MVSCPPIKSYLVSLPIEIMSQSPNAAAMSFATFKLLPVPEKTKIMFLFILRHPNKGICVHICILLIKKHTYLSCCSLELDSSSSFFKLTVVFSNCSTTNLLSAS